MFCSNTFFHVIPICPQQSPTFAHTCVYVCVCVLVCASVSESHFYVSAQSYTLWAENKRTKFENTSPAFSQYTRIFSFSRNNLALEPACSLTESRESPNQGLFLKKEPAIDLVEWLPPHVGCQLVPDTCLSALSYGFRVDCCSLFQFTALRLWGGVCIFLSAECMLHDWICTGMHLNLMDQIHGIFFGNRAMLNDAIEEFPPWSQLLY